MSKHPTLRAKVTLLAKPKKPKALSAKKTKKRVKKKGSNNLMTFGIQMPDVRTLEDLVR